MPVYAITGPRAVYLISGACALWWAYSLLWAAPDMLGRANAYHLLAETADGSVWGSVCLLSGALLLLSGSNSLLRTAQAWAGVVGALWWGLLAFAFFSAPVQTTGSGIYTILSVSTMWAALIHWRARR